MHLCTLEAGFGIDVGLGLVLNVNLVEPSLNFSSKEGLNQVELEPVQAEQALAQTWLA